MLAITTKKHALFITVRGFNGDSESHAVSLAREVDLAVDRLLEVCRNDKWLLNHLKGCESRSQAFAHIFLHVRSVTEDQPWIRDCAALDLCRRVLFLLHPDRFGFEKYGWID